MLVVRCVGGRLDRWPVRRSRSVRRRAEPGRVAGRLVGAWALGRPVRVDLVDRVGRADRPDRVRPGAARGRLVAFGYGPDRGLGRVPGEPPVVAERLRAPFVARRRG
ncbi:hypothetical protein ABT023_07635 [Micromonospora sp. NPDC002296]|uniref:hypothetical protein n=1 Tax=Micromonospora sp. NPDC002296 TaxID=3154271 RepID=UPI00331BA078